MTEKFWGKTRKSDGCWMWTGGKNPAGYGLISIKRDGDKTNHLAHRVSWKLHFGEIPEGIFVCHHCDNPSCVRPDHLFLGTPADNSADAKAKGRLFVSLVRKRQKLSPDADLKIRQLLSEGKTFREVGAIFGVNSSTISMVKRGRPAEIANMRYNK
jgi:HNH endonuclease/Helix-turn-helix domain